MKNLKTGILAVSTAMLMMACGSTPGEKVEAKEEQEVQKAAITAKTLNVDAAASQVMWIGAKPTGTHEGTLNVKEGVLKMEDDKLVAGNFTLDMTSINVTDLEGDDKAKLEGHLKGTSAPEVADHFFNTAKYPTATFEISKIEAVEGKENVTHNITGNLTMKDKTKSVTLPAKVGYADGVLTAETPDFKIDRTEWGIEFKSSKVGEMGINDEISMKIKLQAK